MGNTVYNKEAGTGRFIVKLNNEVFFSTFEVV